MPAVVLTVRFFRRHRTSVLEDRAELPLSEESLVGEVLRRSQHAQHCVDNVLAGEESAWVVASAPREPIDVDFVAISIGTSNE